MLGTPDAKEQLWLARGCECAFKWSVGGWKRWWKKSQTTTWDVENSVNNGINYQPQLVSRISSINSIMHVLISCSIQWHLFPLCINIASRYPSYLDEFIICACGFPVASPRQRQVQLRDPSKILPKGTDLGRGIHGCDGPFNLWF